jgi:hypothetical protein
MTRRNKLPHRFHAKLADLDRLAALLAVHAASPSWL